MHYILNGSLAEMSPNEPTADQFHTGSPPSDEQLKFLGAAMAISAIMGRVADQFDTEIAAWRFRDGAKYGLYLLLDDDAVTVQFEPLDPLSETVMEDRQRCSSVREYCARWGIPAGDLKC
jgi:hypothetical protein